MNTISDSAWRPSVELAALPRPAAASDSAADVPESGDAAASDDGFKLFGDDGFTFLDFLDIINPLQHIPVISTLYRELTGDQIDPGSRVIGSTLFFGPLGTVSAIGDVLIKDATGEDMGQHVMAFLNGETAPEPGVADASGTAVAEVDAPASEAAGPAAVADARVAELPGSEALDPVTAWAVEEVAYRQAMAVKIQSSTQAQPGDKPHPGAPVHATAPLPGVTAAYENSRRALIAAGLAQPAPASQASVAAVPDRLIADSASAAKVRSIIRQTPSSAAMFAATGYGRAAQWGAPRRRAEPADAVSSPPPGTPPGAVAPDGGWFADAMLKAHEKYRAGGTDAGNRLPTTLDVTH